MKKAFQIVAVLTVILLAVLVGASIFVHIVLPPEKAKKKLLGLLTSRLHREVQIGSVSVGLFSGVDVTDFKVSEAPDFSKGTFLSSAHFSLRFELIPLLFRKVVIRQMSLSASEVTIVRFTDGKTYNFSDLSSSPSSVSTSSAPAVVIQTPKSNEPPFVLLVSRAEIEQGTLHFIDRSPAQQSVEIKPLDLKVRNASLVSPFSVDLDMKAQSHGIDARFEMVGDLNLLAGTFKFRRCEVSSGKSQLSLSGRAVNLRSADPTADLKLEMNNFDPAILSPFVQLPAGFRWQGPLNGTARIKGDRAQMSVAANVDLAKTAITYAYQFRKPAGHPMSLSLNGILKSLQDADISSLGLALGTLKLTGHGTVRGVAGSTPSVALNFRSNAFSPADLLPLFPESLPPAVSLKGPVEFSMDWAGTSVSSQYGIKLDGKDLDITYADQFHKPAGMAAKVSAAGEWLKPVGQTSSSLTFSPLALVLGPVEFSGTGRYQTDKGTPQLTLAGKTNTWGVQSIAPLLPTLNVYKPSGQVTVEARLSGPVSQPAVSGTAALDRVALHYEKSELSGVQGSVRFTDQSFSSQKLTGKIDGADFGMSVAGQRLMTDPEITLDGNFTGLDLDKLLPPPPTARNFLWVPLVYAAASKPSDLPMKVTAHVSIGKLKHMFFVGEELEFRCNLTQVTSDLSRVSGTSELKQGPGKVLNLEKLVSLSRMARLALLPLATLQQLDRKGLLKKLGLPSLDDIPFNSIRGVYSLKSGMMNVQPFELLGKDLSLQTQGTIGLAGLQPINLNVLMRLAPGTLGGTIGQLMTDESGRPALKFSATGTVADPHVKAEMAEVGRKAVDQLLRGLGLGSGSSTSGSSSSASTPPADAKDPAKDLQKSLQNIFR